MTWLEMKRKVSVELNKRTLHKLWCCLVQSLQMTQTTRPMMSARPLLRS